MEKIPLLCLFFALSFSFDCAQVENDNADPPLANGLPWIFYKSTCPKMESIVKKWIKFYLNKDITQATGLLCLHFHDCFVQGCDAWVLLNGSASEPSEREGFEIINEIQERVDKACRVVSCSDIADMERSAAVMDRVFKEGRKLLQPHKPKLNRGRGPQHDCIDC
ncbi:hypothetical protein SUGI_0481400 [Cryptomeria japonica]|uniref:cationic peroxidase SPC4-like n=1 Tax=Cryptomeria japonica TaxID=3369 RepID=UPI002408AE00|nr:cationic peroxidase SPC4-like [Cryptomeria japonica]GLJ25167.1 hypothetical protein SUGI_0481400 [Cryptomeria japonica]